MDVMDDESPSPPPQPPVPPPGEPSSLEPPASDGYPASPPPPVEEEDLPPSLDDVIPPPPQEMPPPPPPDSPAPAPYSVEPEPATYDPSTSQDMGEIGAETPQDPTPLEPNEQDPHIYDQVPQEPEDEVEPQNADTKVDVDDDDVDHDTSLPASTSDSGKDSAIHNASTLPSSHPIGGANDLTKQNGGGEIPSKETMKAVSRYRLEAVMWVLIFILAAGGIAVVFYFAYSIVLAQTFSVPDEPFAMRVSLTLENRWMDGLEISTNPVHINLAREFITGVNSTFQNAKSSFVDIYQGATIFHFTNDMGLIRTSFRSFFSGPPSDEAFSTEDTFSSQFETELRAGFIDGRFTSLSIEPDAQILFVDFTTT
ncbi:uncharacterized protein [Diadema setosum]|uniref:uncharacterized protein n=1 Tax=Diadema setosum TaxID=31175 RepID=UPI003B3AE8C5